MSPTIQIVGVAVAVFITVGISIAIQLLDARIAQARFDSNADAEPIETEEAAAKSASPVTVRVLHRGNAGSRKKRGHGR